MALWRESLLAKKVLEGKTRGYRNHPQLERFKNHSEPLNAINAYLFEVWREAERRGYRFDIRKIEVVELKEKIPVTKGQLEYEFHHLLKKLQKRDPERYETLKSEKDIHASPVFLIIEGKVEHWEKGVFP